MAKKHPAKPAELVPTRTADPDEDLVQSAGTAVVGLLKGLAAFFARARDLEQQAQQLLDTSKLLSIPASAEEDAEIQRFVKQTSAAKRAVEEHWSITATISGFHRRMTARRGLATTALERANARGNELHNAYVEAEKRRAREEQLRLEREAEARAQAAREAELKAAYLEAIKREEQSEELSTRELAFVIDVAERGASAQVAAQRAGYKDPVVQASRLLSHRKIQQAITARREAKAIREQAAALATRPLDVGPVEHVAPNVIKAPGAFDRTTHSAELVDEQALVAAVVSGKYGIPVDILRIDTAALNGYARDLQGRINLWPGVRYKKTTKVI